MIYTFPERTDPIRQGDIFFGLPRVEISLEELTVIDSDGPSLMSWVDVVNVGEAVVATLPLKPVAAIVITQDCDNVRSNDITLCEIRNFRDVEGKAKETSRAKSWVNVITTQARINYKWFYLPPDDEIGLAEKSAVDFASTIRVPRIHLETLRELRRGRLNETADEHFRERISEYFRRYPYDEWYALDSEELDAYRLKYPDAEPYPWQEK